MKVSIGAFVCLNKVDYRPGDLADLPDNLVEQWFFQALVKEGKIQVLEYTGPEFEEKQIPISDAAKRVQVQTLAEAFDPKPSDDESSPKAEDSPLEAGGSVESPALPTKKQRGKRKG